MAPGSTWDTRLDVTFTITTGRRLPRFIQTMENFLNRCRDHDRIKDWILIDDNSSAPDRSDMQQRYPFFRFIWKTPEEAGHAQSLNSLLSEIKTKYALQWEDDWTIDHPFFVSDLYTFLEESGGFQVKFLNEVESPAYRHPDQAVLNVRSHFFTPVKTFNPLLRTALSEHLRNEMISIFRGRGLHELADQLQERRWATAGYWWPGFTLNPSLYNVDLMRDRVGRFEDVPEFEFYHGIKIFCDNLPVWVYLDARCLHQGGA